MRKIPLCLATLACIAGCLFIATAGGGPPALRFVLKPLATALILAIPLVSAGAAPRPYRRLVALGLLFSLIGDVLLLFPSGFLWGLASFLGAHVAYLLAFRSRGGFRFTPWLFAIYAALAVSLLALIAPRAGALAVPVAVYGIALGAMAWQAAEVWRSARDRSALLAMLGAILFLASDAALAFNRFRSPLPFRDLLVMGTYWPAQILIAWSVIAVGSGGGVPSPRGSRESAGALQGPY
jgi:uncharacterized membrane protein YhhN